MTKEQPRRVYALRASAAVFGHNALKIPTYQPEPQIHVPNINIEQPPEQPDAPQAPAAKTFPPGTVLPQDQWDEWTADTEDLPGTLLFLDREYESVVNGSLVAVQVPEQAMQVFHIDRVDVRSRNAYGISGKTTVLDLEGTSKWSAFDANASIKLRLEQFVRFIRGTAVYVQSELLPLAEEPIEETIPDGVDQDTLELDRVYNGLQPGRWIIVSGEVVSLEGTSGVRDSELVMISSVEQTYNPALPDETLRTRLKLANQLHNTYLRTSVTVYGNVTDATHGETRREVLGSGDASQTFQKFEIKQSPLTYLSAPTPSGVESTLEVRVNDVRWAETDNLFQLLGGERGYITRTDDEGKTTVIFGNGRYGARPPTGDENLRAIYRSGIGKPGNVAAGQISQLATRPLGVKSVLNPLRSSGGADPESRDSARRNAPLALLSLDRLVSVQDYADFSRTFAGIGKASAVRVSNGQGELVYLTIAGAEDIPILETSDLYRNLVVAVQRFGDPYQPFTIKVREAVLLMISARVRLDPDYEWALVVPQIQAALQEEFSFEKRELGQDALLSEAYRAFHTVAGVVYVDIDLFDGISEELANDPEGLAAKMAELAGSTSISTGGSNPEPQPGSRVHVRLRPDENALGPGYLQPAQVAYLNPDIPATLLLEEIP